MKPFYNCFVVITVHSVSLIKTTMNGRIESFWKKSPLTVDKIRLKQIFTGKNYYGSDIEIIHFQMLQ